MPQMDRYLAPPIAALSVVQSPKPSRLDHLSLINKNKHYDVVKLN